MNIAWTQISNIEDLPNEEVIAFGFQGEILIGTLFVIRDQVVCTTDYVELHDVTHWAPKPNPPKN